MQLPDSARFLKRTIVPRLGKPHVSMAALRALCDTIENSGSDNAWMEADVYGSFTTSQIVKCTQYKCALHVHI